MIAIISLLVSILLPSLQKAKALAQSTVCQSNLKQISLLVAYYQEDNERYLPDMPDNLKAIDYSEWPETWQGKLMHYTDGDKKVFGCPSHQTLGQMEPSNYGVNTIYRYGRDTVEPRNQEKPKEWGDPFFRMPDRILYLADCDYSWLYILNGWDVALVHGNMEVANVLCLDMHVEANTTSDPFINGPDGTYNPAYYDYIYPRKSY